MLIESLRATERQFAGAGNAERCEKHCNVFVCTQKDTTALKQVQERTYMWKEIS